MRAETRDSHGGTYRPSLHTSEGFDMRNCIGSWSESMVSAGEINEGSNISPTLSRGTVFQGSSEPSSSPVAVLVPVLEPMSSP